MVKSKKYNFSPMYDRNGSSHEEESGDGKESGDARGKAVGLDKDYAAAAEKILRSMGNEQSYEAAARILGTEQSQSIYKDLRQAGASNRQAVKYLKHALSDIAQGRNMSFKSYAHAVAEYIAESGEYVEALDKMREDEVISEQEYSTLKERVIDDTNNMMKRGNSILEKLASAEKVKRAAVWLFMAIGAILMLVSGYSITAAVVGSAFEVSSLFILGLILFVFGILFWVRRK